MRLILIGSPGSGKSTQAQTLSKNLRIPHISTGDIVRAEKGSLKKEIEKYLSKGQLVPDNIIYKIFKKRISKPDCKIGFILDGIPRNLKQAKKLEKTIKPERVISLKVPTSVLVERLLKRKRKDDTKEIIKERLKVYNAQTRPLIKYYKTILININGEQTVEEIEKDISDALI